jgi:hypothetical protein
MSKAYKVGDNDDLVGVPNLNFKNSPTNNVHAKDIVERTTKYKGYANFRTWQVADALTNNEYLHELCRHFYLDGYKTFGSLRCKLHEYGPKWRVDGITEIYWDHEDIRSKEITAIMAKIFNSPKTKPTK